jgi:hypothetical protein
MNKKLVRAALKESSTIVTHWRDHLLECCCLFDKKTRKPLRETLMREAKPDVRRMDRCIEKIDLALKEVRGHE